MLNALELRIVAVVADRLAGRDHLTVHAGPAPAAAPEPGQGRLFVTLADFSPNTAFRAERVRAILSPPSSRRVLGLEGLVRLRFQLQAAAATPDSIDQARALLLEDLSLAAHALADPVVLAGSVFETEADSGFRVTSFALEKGTGDAVIPGITASGELAYRCQVEIWPPKTPEAEGVMTDFSRTIAVLPLDLRPAEPVVFSGQRITLRVRALPLLRPAAAGQPAAPMSVAVRVLSSAPPSARGAVTSGSDGKEAGVRLVAATAPETLIVFQAPALASGERTEYVALHFATPDGKAGVFLGSIAVRIRGGA